MILENYKGTRVPLGESEDDMTCKQQSFDMRTSKSRGKAGPKLAARMIAILTVRRDWTKRADLKHYGLTERECRLGREASNGRVLASQQGYKLISHATPDEYWACRGFFQTQVTAAQKNIQQLDKRWHNRTKKGELNLIKFDKRSHAIINRKVN